MMASPYHFTEKTIISFSGGRTSAFMLYQILLAHGGVLPDHVKCCFANTGKERIETLDFVDACAVRWNCHITWIEYAPAAEGKFQIVSHNSAARAGEPFEQLVDKKKFLPNPVSRFCTTELKIRPMKRYAISLGWRHWDVAIGLRFDEPGRVAKRKNSKRKERFTTVMPLNDAEITKWDVREFWMQQPFDLGLANVKGKTPEGNCDLCFLKGARLRQRLMKLNPGSGDWWIGLEKKKLSDNPAGNRFRNDSPSYEDLQRQEELVFDDDDGELMECFCHD